MRFPIKESLVSLWNKRFAGSSETEGIQCKSLGCTGMVRNSGCALRRAPCCDKGKDGPRACSRMLLRPEK